MSDLVKKSTPLHLVAALEEVGQPSAPGWSGRLEVKWHSEDGQTVIYARGGVPLCLSPLQEEWLINVLMEMRKLR